MKKTVLSLCVALGAMFSSCQSSQEVKTLSGLNPKDFETVVDGDSTALYVLTNKNGMEVCVTNFGARIVSVMVPDVKGQLQDLIPLSLPEGKVLTEKNYNMYLDYMKEQIDTEKLKLK